MNHPEPPTKPCPTCGEDLPAAVADARRFLNAESRRSFTAYVESAVAVYPDEPEAALSAVARAIKVAREVDVKHCPYEAADLVAATRHRLNDE